MDGTMTVLKAITCMCALPLVQAICDSAADPLHPCVMPVVLIAEPFRNGQFDFNSFCSEQKQISTEVTECRELVMASCRGKWQTDNLDQLTNLMATANNYSTQYCGPGVCTDIIQRISNMDSCFRVLSGGMPTPPTTTPNTLGMTVYCQHIQTMLDCLQTGKGTCEAPAVNVKELEPLAYARAYSDYCPDLTYKGQSINGEMAITFPPDFQCLEQILKCTARVPGLQQIMTKPNFRISEVCGNYDVGTLSRFVTCVSATGCPVDESNPTIFSLESIITVCSCPYPDITGKLEECGKFVAKLETKPRGYVPTQEDCKTGEVFACCVKPVLTQCPDLYHFLTNPNQTETEADIILKTCDITPHSIKTKLNEEYCSEISIGNMTSITFILFTVIEVIIALLFM